jgi:type VI secretion system Hcp family effector
MSARPLRVLGLSAVLSLALLGLPVESAWAFKGVAFITGAVQGAIQGDNTQKGTEGAITLRHVSTHFDDLSSSNLFEFALVKDPDKASVKLIRAFIGSELLTVTIQFFRTINTGAVVLYHTVLIERARVSSFETKGDPAVAGGVVEEVQLRFGRITFTDEVNKQSVTLEKFQ